MQSTPTPDFRQREFLVSHIQSILAFYDGICIDPDGGFYHHFRDDGSVYDRSTRHLVSSTRFVFNYAAAGRFFHRDDYLDRARHGLAYLHRHHLDPATGGYRWILNDHETVDGTNHAYGLAFVLLAHAGALSAGITDAQSGLESTFQLMERHFWDEHHELYRDEISPDFKQVAPYRGQNANMHACEALLAAYDATGDEKYIRRAYTVAKHITQRQTQSTGGLIWEHYDEQWNTDWDYNRNDPKHLFRPWGFQPGHQTEWAKLLLILNEHVNEDWTVTTASQLFDRALENAWDNEHGGICYGFDPDGEVCDGDKYFWVQAESLAAAARLGARTGDDRYWQWYTKIWNYSWAHMIDHEYGAWYRILTRDNQRYDDLKSPAGKTDYHTIGACLDVISTLDAS